MNCDNGILCSNRAATLTILCTNIILYFELLGSHPFYSSSVEGKTILTKMPEVILVVKGIPEQTNLPLVILN